MRVDFYHLTRDPAETLVVQLASRVLAGGGRVCAVIPPERQEALSRALWSAGPASFLAHGRAGEGDEALQPILLAAEPTAANGADHLILADGLWREGEDVARTFFLFDEAGRTSARETWRALGEREGCERHYWKQEGGRWREGP